MPTVEALNATSEWVAHEFRVKCRSRNWLCKVTGVEALFAKRIGALRVICGSFSGEHLTLRSLPDMAVRSPKSTFLIEVKECNSDTPNVAIELWQYLWFLKLSDLGSTIHYLFGMPSATGRLMSWILPAESIIPAAIHVPPRVKKEWPEILKAELRVEVQRLRDQWGIGVTEVHGCGSGDPYILSRKTDCLVNPLEEWMSKQGAGFFKPKERESWEGKEAAQHSWKSYSFEQWMTTKKRGKLGQQCPQK